MVNKILNTFFTNIVLFISTFCYSILLARLFGAEGKGWANLFNTNIKIIVLTAQFFGGSALVYLLSRTNKKQLFWLSNSAALLTSLITSLIVFLLGYVSHEFLIHLIFLSFIHTLFQNNNMLLLGEERVKTYNGFLLAQSLLLLGLIYYLFFYTGDIYAFIYALYLSYIPCVLLQSSLVLNKKNNIQSTWASTFNKLYSYGFMAQLSTLINYFNYRLAFYFILAYTLYGERNVGVYAVSIAFCEAIWLLGRSIALVLFSRISNDKKYASKITVNLFKVNFFLTILMATVLICIPGSFYVFLFGNENFEIVQVLNVILWPGIIGVGSTFIFSHYFSGKGQFGINVLGTIFSLIVTVVGGIVLIPEWGILGAAITASISFSLLGIYFTYRFVRYTGIPLSFLSFTIRELWEVKRYLSK